MNREWWLDRAAPAPERAEDDVPRRPCGGPPRLPGPLHTDGRWIVDAEGRRVKLAGVNWSGAETQSFVVGGLDVRPLDDLAALVAAGGFNSVRLPWSNQLVEEDPVVAADHLAANRDLQGRHALEVLDAVVAALAKHGLMVVLDNHRSRADWCCDAEHGDGLWHSPDHPESSWLAAWRTMAARYRDVGNVVGAELRNEIRPAPELRPGPTKATWGDGHPLTDWRAAAERAGNVVLAENPELLIIVGGRDFQTHLRSAFFHPVRLDVSGRLVYAVHDYRWIHPGTEIYPVFAAYLWLRFGHLVARGLVAGDDRGVAPIYLSETGTCTTPNATERCHPDDPRYWRHLVRYLERTDLDFAYWPLNGTQGAGYGRTYGAPETYGLLRPDWSGYGDQRVMAALRRLQRPRRGPGRPGRGCADADVMLDGGNS